MQVEITEATKVPIEIFKNTMWEIAAPYYEALIVAFIILAIGGIIATVSKSRVIFGFTKFVAGLAAFTILMRSFGIDFF